MTDHGSPLTLLLMVPTGGPVIATEISGTDMQKYLAVSGLIGGLLTAIGGRHLGSGWAMFLDVDAHEKQLPMNENATRLATYLGWPHDPGQVIHGTVCLVGKDGDTEVTVPPVVVRAARELEIPVLTLDHEHYDEEAVRS